MGDAPKVRTGPLEVTAAALGAFAFGLFLWRCVPVITDPCGHLLDQDSRSRFTISVWVATGAIAFAAAAGRHTWTRTARCTRWSSPGRCWRARP